MARHLTLEFGDCGGRTAADLLNEAGMRSFGKNSRLGPGLGTARSSRKRPVQIIEPLAVRIPEACHMIGIGRSKLYELIADGTIEIVKIESLPSYPYRS